MKKYNKTNKAEIKMAKEKNEDLFHWERQMSKDLNEILDQWCIAGIPIINATTFSAHYIANFVFHSMDPILANHVLMTSISKELLRYEEIDDNEVSMH